MNHTSNAGLPAANLDKLAEATTKTMPVLLEGDRLRFEAIRELGENMIEIYPC